MALNWRVLYFPIFSCFRILISKQRCIFHQIIHYRNYLTPLLGILLRNIILSFDIFILFYFIFFFLSSHFFLDIRHFRSRCVMIV
jgi:hypothetical protein